MTPDEYLAAIKAALVTIPSVRSFEVTEEWMQPDRGYIRVRMQLANADYLEAAEYFVVTGGECKTERYRYQWMDSARHQIRKRWDNVAHYPDLPGYPDHVHLVDGRVEPGKRLSLVALLDELTSGGFTAPEE